LNRYIDISVPVSPDLPRWPGSPAIEFHRSLDLERGDIANDTTLRFSVHTGTHVDAPLHFLKEGGSVEQMPLNILIGPAVVVDLSDVEVVAAETLDRLALPTNTKRLLIRTRNSLLWQTGVKEFQPDFVALTADAAQWVVDRGICLIGVDYLSVQRFKDGPETHLILLEAEVAIVEGLNLIDVSAGEYELVCLPLNLKGVEGAPARAILRPLPPT
jgi:arylformamidase